MSSFAVSDSVRCTLAGAEPEREGSVLCTGHRDRHTTAGGDVGRGGDGVMAAGGTVHRLYAVALQRPLIVSRPVVEHHSKTAVPQKALQRSAVLPVRYTLQHFTTPLRTAPGQGPHMQHAMQEDGSMAHATRTRVESTDQWPPRRVRLAGGPELDEATASAPRFERSSATA